MKRILTVDIGNSTIALGLFLDYELVDTKRLKTDPSADSGYYCERLENILINNEANGLDGIIISSVVPGLTGIISESLTSITGKKPLILGRSVYPDLLFGVTRPDEVGHDRIADVVAASRLYGDPSIVIDFGTATTLSIIKENTFIGGTIMPGVEMMARALHTYTSRLPLVDLSPEILKVEEISAIGKDTRGNIISGIIFGTAGAVDRIVSEIEKREGCRFGIVLTGGFSVIMARFMKRDLFLDPYLTLKGLRYIYERKEDA